MVVDATVPLLLSLLALVLLVGLGFAASRAWDRRPRRPRGARGGLVALRCPRVVLLDDVVPGTGRLVAAS